MRTNRSTQSSLRP